MPDDKLFEKVPNYYTGEKYAREVAEHLMKKQDDEYNAFLDRIIARAQDLQRRDHEEVTWLKVQIQNLERQLQEQTANAERADKLFQERDAKVADIMRTVGTPSYEFVADRIRDYIDTATKLKRENARMRTAIQGISGICKHQLSGES